MIEDQDVGDRRPDDIAGGLQQRGPQTAHIGRGGEHALEPAQIGVIEHHLQKSVAQLGLAAEHILLRPGDDLEAERHHHQRLDPAFGHDRHHELIVQADVFPPL